MTLNSHHNGEPSVIRINQIFWKLIPVQEILVESFTFWISVRAWCNISEFENILLHLFVHTSWLPKSSSPRIRSCCVHRMETHRSQLRFLDGAVSADLWTADSWTRSLSPTDSFRHKGVSLDNRLPMKIVRMLGGMPWCCNPPLLWCSSSISLRSRRPRTTPWSCCACDDDNVQKTDLQDQSAWCKTLMRCSSCETRRIPWKSRTSSCWDTDIFRTTYRSSQRRIFLRRWSHAVRHTARRFRLHRG